MATQEPNACEAADSSFDAIAFAEVLRVTGYLMDQFSLGDLDGVEYDDVQEHG